MHLRCFRQAHPRRTPYPDTGVKVPPLGRFTRKMPPNKDSTRTLSRLVLIQASPPASHHSAVHATISHRSKRGLVPSFATPTRPPRRHAFSFPEGEGKDRALNTLRLHPTLAYLCRAASALIRHSSDTDKHMELPAPRGCTPRSIAANCSATQRRHKHRRDPNCRPRDQLER